MPQFVSGLTSTSYTPKEILWGSSEDCCNPPISFTLAAAGLGSALEKGTVLGFITSSGKALPYSNSASDGSEVAMAILAERVPAGSADVVALAYVNGLFVEAELTGLDSAAKTDFKSRSFPNGLLYIP